MQVRDPFFLLSLLVPHRRYDLVVGGYGYTNVCRQWEEGAVRKEGRL